MVESWKMAQHLVEAVAASVIIPKAPLEVVVGLATGNGRWRLQFENWVLIIMDDVMRNEPMYLLSEEAQHSYSTKIISITSSQEE